MGREARVLAEAGGESGEVRALLEADGLTLRGAFKRVFSRAAIDNPTVEGDWLRFESGGETVRLALGVAAAARWRQALQTPPPDLATKLGLTEGRTALIVGPLDDETLAEALEGRTTADVAQAAMILAEITGPEDLAAVMALAHPLPLWALYPKGKATRFGDSAIRTTLRAAGWRDTKSCAVSPRLTATRYHPPAG